MRSLFLLLTTGSSNNLTGSLSCRLEGKTKSFHLKKRKRKDIKD
ncbi:hypothetical protein EV06_0952 [Prochlorococcus sp. MIT 0602]|nr:hypothetical protein EV06_0952 [Prochlorococcus sp. MIT 0602]KGG17360.1 hypothetical protein EV07_0798 [Prochlorococcus sp. MIT 0603]